jgi:hypothetical protein
VKIVFYTSYNQKYSVDMETGFITHVNGFSQPPRASREWLFVAFRHVRRNETIRLADIRTNPEILKDITWTFKNGFPQWTVLDKDHGTTRLWGNTHVHGVAEAHCE